MTQHFDHPVDSRVKVRGLAHLFSIRNRQENGCPTFRGLRKVGTTQLSLLRAGRSGSGSGERTAERQSGGKKDLFEVGSRGAQPSNTAKAGAAHFGTIHTRQKPGPAPPRALCFCRRGSLVLAYVLPYILGVLNNKKILECPIILFLGAGASAPLGKPMMAEFVEKASTAISDGDQQQMLIWLRRFRGDDLEGILGELDTIIELNYATSVQGKRKVEGYPDPVSFSLNRYTAANLQRNLKHAIIREYRNVDAEKSLEIYRPLFDALFQINRKNWLPVFTTNYDPAIEDFHQKEYPQYELCDGFQYDPADRHNYWNRSVFDSFAGNPERRNLILFKLHGSTDWLRVKSRNRIRRGQAMYDALDHDAYENILIYPATREIATEDPFYTGYEYFERCCEHARLCIAIGYSFRDYDALTRLRGAMSVNDDLRLLVVSPSADEILKGIPVADSRKAPLPYKFGVDSELMTLIRSFVLDAPAQPAKRTAALQ